ncbi:Anaphase-promoting complex (APC), subunit 11 [Handroanthus impetiginosus]|uniref:Anaphase-promoting complex (APC), subunit 11 n=1 Tax=Handroanthus impetiginosus TaxID=429701 RepID=A0A2G9I5N0_9LAMI|nr:Anaphase-promoting complex (APC), subunit 11 [Handroanthus impetiginosus]
MDEERRKRTRRTTTMDQLEERRIFPVLETIQSESDEGNTTSASDSDQDFHQDYFEYSDEEFLYGGTQYELDFSEDEYNYGFDQEFEEDDVDPDALSYEELIALGEMVGVENRGLSEAEINKHLQPLTCQSPSNLLIDRCEICQVEYEQGEQLVTLHCDHPYHRDCIVKWLQMKKICPICNNEVSSLEISKAQ